MPLPAAFPMAVVFALAGIAGPPADTTFPVRALAPGVFLVPGDSGRGSEGRPNAGFVVTGKGVVAIDALGSPRDGETLVRTIRAVTAEPILWLVLTHHHPDHHFGAIAFRRAGAKVIAHPDTRVLAGDAGPDALVADWTRVVGLDAMRGFEYADSPDQPVTGTDTLRLGDKTWVITHPGAAHSAGDLTIWLPAEGVLFAGDLLIEDGVTMVVDGDSRVLLRALDDIEALRPRIAVPGHGAVPRRPAELVARTRTYITQLQQSMRAAVERGTPMRRALASLPPADETRPVSLNSRRRRNALRVYLEEERIYMGLDSVQ